MPLGAFRLNSLARYEAPAGRTANTLTTFGNAQVDTAQSKFGGASMLVDGNGDYLSTQFTLTTDKTFECWIRPANVSGEKYVFRIHNSSDTFQYVFGINNNAVYVFSGGTTSGGTVTVNNWHHIACTMSSTATTIYLNGTNVGSRGGNGSLTNAIIYIGGFSNNLGMNGHIDEIRISNNLRYTANFTPSTTAFTNDANTLLLVHCDGTDGSTTFTDDNS